MTEQDRIQGESRHFASHAAFGATPLAWWRMLSRYGGAMHARFLPKVAWITFVVLVSSPFVLWERLRHGRRIARITPRAPVFILGYPRSGTTYLHYLLARDQRFAFCDVFEALMPATFLTTERLFRSIVRRRLPTTRPMDNLRMDVDLPKEEEFALACLSGRSIVAGYLFPTRLEQVFEQDGLLPAGRGRHEWQGGLLHFMRKLTLRHGDRPLLMKSPFNTARVDAIRELFPDARFIHIHRDPATVFASNVRLYERILPMLALCDVDRASIRRFILRSYKDTYEHFITALGSIPEGQVAHLRYEELVADPVKVLQGVYARLDLGDFEATRPTIEEEARSYAGYRTNRYTLSDDDRAALRTEWGAVAQRWGRTL